MHVSSIGALVAFSILALDGSLSAQKDRFTLKGSVLDQNGAALAGARVTIATARVRKGFSPY